MADFNMRGIDDFMSDLNTLDTDRIAPIMLEEAVHILEENVKRRTAAHKATGALAESMKASKAKQTKEGYSISVRPTGKDDKGVSNMEKACYLEYGTLKQTATPVISPAVRESEEAVVEKMQEAFEREMKKLGDF